MKKLFFTFLISISLVSLGQAPQEISYQGVARNASGSLLSNQNIGIKLDLHQGSAGGSVVFSETHNKTTNAFGLFTLGIGSVNTAAFTAINWANGPYFLEVSMDPAGGSSYTSVGTQQFMSVPYALYAKTAGNASPTPTISINAPNTVTSAGGGYTINIPASATYSAGTGINVTGNTISNTAPDQTVVLNAAGATTVTGTYPAFTINTPTAQVYSAGNGIDITGGVISNTAAAVTPTIVGTGATTVTGTYPSLTINTPTTQVYSAGNGIDITGGVISNTAAAVTPTIVGTGATTVTGTYPNLTINTPTVAPDQAVSLTGTGTATVTGSYPNFTVNVPSGTSLPTGFNGQFLFNNGTIWDTLPRPNLFFDGTNFGVGTTAPQATFHVVGAGRFDASVSTPQIYANAMNLAVGTFTNAGDVLTNDGAGNATWQSLPTPTLSYNNGTNVLSLSQGTTVTTATLVGTGSNTVSIVGAGLATVTPTTGSTFTVDVPSPSFTNNGPTTITGTYPNYTVSSTSTPSTTLVQGTNVTLNNSGNTYTVSAVTPTITGTGATTVTGTYPNLTINTPTTAAATPPTIIGTGATTVTSSGNTFTVNTPASQTYTNGAGISISSGSVITNTAPDQTITLNGTGATSVTGTYPNFTITSSTTAATSLTQGANVTVSGTAPNYTVSAPAYSISLPGGNTVQITNGTSTSTAAINATSLTLTGTNNNILSAGGNTVALNTYTPGTGITMTGTAPNYTLSSPNQSLSINSNSLSITGGNTITLPSSSTTTLTQGTNVTITGTAPSYTVSSVTPTLNVVGGSLTGAYPTQTLTIPTSSTTILTQSTGITVTGTAPNYTLSSPNQSLSVSGNSLSITGANTVVIPPSAVNGTGTGIATVTTSANNFTVDVPSPTFTGVGSTSVTGTYPTYTISTPTVAAGWTTVGNSGTVDGTNFIGTTDNIPFNIKVNNQPAGRISNSGGTDATFFGYQAGNVNTGNDNSAFGHQALLNNSSGANNTAMGFQALRFNSTGSANTAYGHWALNSNTTGFQNIAVGGNALFSNTTGIYNTGIGARALNANTIGAQNTGVGHDVLYSNVNGSNNSAFGETALYNSNTGNNNTAIGTAAGYSNTAGSGNVFLGYQAGYNETGSNKLYIANSNAGQPLIYGDFAIGNVGIGTSGPLTDKMEINHSSSTGNTHLHLKQTGADAFSRIKFTNAVAPGKFWLSTVTSAPADNNSGYNFFYHNGSVGHNVFTVAGDGLVSVNPFNTMNNARFYVGGKAKIDSSLTMAGYFSEPTLSPSSEGRIYFDRTSQKFKVSENNGPYVDLIPGTGLSPWVQGPGMITQSNPGDLVGIGTLAPTSPLHVYGMADPLQITVQNSGGAFKTGYHIQTASQEWFIGKEAGGSNALRFTDITNGQVRMAIETSGNVGIGTTSPNAMLDIQNNGNAYGGMQLNMNDNSNGSNGIQVLHNGLGNGGYFEIDNASSNAYAVQGKITNGTPSSSAVKGLNMSSSGNAGNFQIFNSSNSQSALYVTNDGLGQGGYFENTNVSNFSSAVYAQSNGGGATISGYNTGTGGAAAFAVTNATSNANAMYSVNHGMGRAAFLENTNSSNGSNVLYVKNVGTNDAIMGEQWGTNGSTLRLSSGNGSNTSPTIFAQKSGPGAVAFFENINGTTNANAVAAVTYGTGSTIFANNQGTAGHAGHFNIPGGSSNTDAALFAANVANGNAFEAQCGAGKAISATNASNTNAAIFATNSGTSDGIQTFALAGRALYAQNSSNTSAAVEIANNANSTSLYVYKNSNAGNVASFANLSGANGSDAVVISNSGSGNALNITGKVKIADGTEGNLKVLTSDASGNASWQAPSGSSLAGGITNRITKWTSATTVGNANIVDAGSITMNPTTSLPGVVINSNAVNAHGGNLSLQSNGAATTAGTGLGSLYFGATGGMYDEAGIRGERDAASSGGTDLPSALVFYTTADNASTNLERMRINNAGNVGIGSSAPSAKLHAVNAANTGSSGRFENNASTNTADAVLVQNSSTGAGVHVIATATSTVGLWLENAHIKSTQASAPATSTVSVSGITSLTITPTGCTDVKGNILAVVTHTGNIALGNSVTYRVTFAKPYQTAPTVILTPTTDFGIMGYYISAINTTSFNVTIRCTANTGESRTNFGLNYWVIE